MRWCQTLDKKDMTVLSAIILISFLIHLPIFLWSISIDTCVQLEMAYSLISGRGYSVEGQASRHFSPLLPTLYLPFTSIFGFNPNAIHVFQMILLPFLILVAYYVGALYSRKVAVITAFLTAFDPIIYGSMAYGLSEALVVIFLLMSFYFIVKGTKNTYYLSGSAIFSVLLYLTKASTGYLILCAVIVGFIWRLYYDGKSVFKDKGYIIAGAIFIFIFALWSMRNLIVLGTPWISPFTTEILTAFIEEPVSVIFVAYVKYITIYGIYLLLMFSVPIYFLHRKIRLKSLITLVKSNQMYSAIVVFIGGIWFISAFFAAAISTVVSGSETLLHIRYIGVINPLIYIVFALSVGPDLKKVRSSYLAIFVYLTMLILLIVPNTMFYPQLKEYESLYDYLEDHGVRDVWSDEPLLLKYNNNQLSDIKIHHIYMVDEIRDNMTLVVTDNFLAKIKNEYPEMYSNINVSEKYAYFNIVFYHQSKIQE